jgi:hypothetical protein
MAIEVKVAGLDIAKNGSVEVKSQIFSDNEVPA